MSELGLTSPKTNPPTPAIPAITASLLGAPVVPAVEVGKLVRFCFDLICVAIKLFDRIELTARPDNGRQAKPMSTIFGLHCGDAEVTIR